MGWYRHRVQFPPRAPQTKGTKPVADWKEHFNASVRYDEKEGCRAHVGWGVILAVLGAWLIGYLFF
jgi:3-methyladenine DNA glycosylase AlkC